MLIKHDEVILDEYEILSIDFGNLDVNNKIINLNNNNLYDYFINNISVNGITYKVYNNDIEI